VYATKVSAPDRSYPGGMDGNKRIGSTHRGIYVPRLLTGALAIY
jgi:hypothetical protein